MTQATIIQNKWREITLGELCTKIGDGLHGTPQYSEEGEYFFVNGNNIENGKIAIKQETKKVGLEEYQKHKKDLNQSTILLSINGTIGNLAKYNNEKCILGKSAAYLNIKNGVSKNFIYYLLLDRTFQLDISRNANGSTIKNVSLAQLRNYKFLLPSLSEQRSIAAVLSSLDNKIELLREQNKTLEDIAQAIFREWFVKFNFPGSTEKRIDSELGEIPEGWRVGKIGDILELSYGKALKAEERTGKGYPVFGSNGVIGLHDEYLVKGHGIIIGRKGTMGSVIWTDDDFFPIDTTFFVEDKLGVKDLYFHYFLLKKQDFERLGSDSAVPGLNRNSVYSVSVIVPSFLIINKFNQLLSSFFEKRKSNANQIKTLSTLRDLLLPRLMSGKLRVDDVYHNQS